ncbi:MAG: hypothetical protein JW991_01105 [Candidatus Pacebacteria bacterium]|nr:hypothetical protein [Candidatus Paceibacterota bacterium]
MAIENMAGPDYKIEVYQQKSSETKGGGEGGGGEVVGREAGVGGNYDKGFYPPVTIEPLPEEPSEPPLAEDPKYVPLEQIPQGNEITATKE